MIAGPWSSRDEFEEWWKANVIAFNRLSVTDPDEWERIAKAIEAFHRRIET
jgi:hypothetical protein